MRAISLCAFVVVLLVNTEVFGINHTLLLYLLGGGPPPPGAARLRNYGSFQAQLAYGLRRLETEQKHKFTLTSTKNIKENVMGKTTWNAEVEFKEGKGTVEIVEQSNGKLEKFNLNVGGTNYTVGRDP